MTSHMHMTSQLNLCFLNADFVAKKKRFEPLFSWTNFRAITEDRKTGPGKKL